MPIPRRAPLPRPLARALAALCLLAAATPAPARACWDGLRASSERVEISVEAEAMEWTAGEPERYARALIRAEALLPDGVSAEAWFEAVTLCPEADPAGCTPPEEADGPEAIVRAVGALAGAAPEAVDAALGMDAPLWTVQIGAWSEPAWAEHAAERLRREGGPHGAVEVGGFPSLNDPSRLVRGEDGIYRVSAGTFLSRAEAERARERIAADLGVEGYVRPL